MDILKTDLCFAWVYFINGRLCFHLFIQWKRRPNLIHLHMNDLLMYFRYRLRHLDPAAGDLQDPSSQHFSTQGHLSYTRSSCTEMEEKKKKSMFGPLSSLCYCEHLILYLYNLLQSSLSSKISLLLPPDKWKILIVASGGVYIHFSEYSTTLILNCIMSFSIIVFLMKCIKLKK